MIRGLFDHLEQASHIVAGMGVEFGEAMGMVRAAEAAETAALRKSTEVLNRSAEKLEQQNALREQEYRDADREIESNVIYGVDFGRR